MIEHARVSSLCIFSDVAEFCEGTENSIEALAILTDGRLLEIAFDRTRSGTDFSIRVSFKGPFKTYGTKVASILECQYNMGEASVEDLQRLVKNVELYLMSDRLDILYTIFDYFNNKIGNYEPVDIKTVSERLESARVIDLCYAGD